MGRWKDFIEAKVKGNVYKMEVICCLRVGR